MPRLILLNLKKKKQNFSSSASRWIWIFFILYQINATVFGCISQLWMTAKTQTPDVLSKTCERIGWPSFLDATMKSHLKLFVSGIHKSGNGEKEIR